MIRLRLGLIVAGFALGTTCVHAQRHRATRLDNPATRFADPLRSIEDLRNPFNSETLQADFDYIARECGYQGDPEDLRQVAAKGLILELRTLVGPRLPAMLSRKQGKPGLLQFAGTATSQHSTPANGDCSTRVAGVPGVLLEDVGKEDTIQVGDYQTYEIIVLNQGTAVLTTTKIVSILEPSQGFVLASDTSGV